MKKWIWILLALVLTAAAGHALANELKMPEGLKTIEVEAFAGDTALDQVTLPNGLEAIGGRSFADSSVKSIRIPASVVSIGTGAFDGCDGLTTVFFDGTQENWDSLSAGSGISGLEHVTVYCLGGAEMTDSGTCGDHLSWTLDSNGLLTISGQGAMTDYSYSAASPWDEGQIKTVLVMPGVTGIGNMAFYNYTNTITSIMLPGSVERIGSNAFTGTNVTEITLPAGVTEIGYGAFSSCYDLEAIRVDPANESFSSIDGVLFNKEQTLLVTYPLGRYEPQYTEHQYTIPSCATGIADYAFEWTHLTSITIPDSVSSIGVGAFQNSYIESLELPSGLTSIPRSAFAACQHMTSIYIPASIVEIDYGAFTYCTALENVYYQGTETDWASISISEGNGPLSEAAFHWSTDLQSDEYLYSFFTFTPIDAETCSVKQYTGSSAHVRIPSRNMNGQTVTAIDANTFYGNSSITSVSLPLTVTSIGNLAFSNCAALSEITLHEGITSIGRLAFDGCVSLTDIQLPQSLTTLGEYAFRGCSGLKSISIPSAVQTIRTYAFSGCSALEQVTFHEGLVSIQDDAFRGCTGLKEIRLPQGLTTLGSRVFYECTGLSFISFPDSITAMYEDCIQFCTGLKRIECAWNSRAMSILLRDYNDIIVEIPGTVQPETSVSLFTFDNTDNGYAVTGYTGSATQIVIPAHDANGAEVTAIASGAFKNNTTLTSVTLPDTIRFIGEEAFYSCSGLLYVNIPEGVTQIKKSTFQLCTRLTRIRFPSTIVSVEDRAFDTCFDLYKASFNEGLVSIGAYAFSGCALNMECTLPSTLSSIGDYAFKGCKMESIVIPASLATVGGSAFSGCRELKNVTIQPGFKIIGESMFFDCRALSSITLPETITEIGQNAFAQFADNCGLESIVIPDSVSKIGGRAFAKTRITNITVPGSCLELGYGAFEDCARLVSAKIVGFEGERIWMGYETFKGCANLVSVKLPNSIIQLNSSSYDLDLTGDFEGCSSLTTIYCEPDTEVWTWAEANGYVPADAAEWSNDDEMPPQAQITDFSFESDTILAGDILAFSVTAENAYKVQLAVDGIYYNEYLVNSEGRAEGLRVMTLAGERKVAFRAYGKQGWGPLSEEKTILVTSNGPLDAPNAVWNDVVYKGEGLTVTWNKVPYADGYRLYIKHPDGTTDQIDPIPTDPNYHYGSDSEPFSYTWTADQLDSTGNWSVLVMAYGRGYSQSSVGCDFEVKDAFRTWTGWPQREKVPTFATSDSSQDNGYVDYIDPVTVLGEENGRYKIEMTLTAGGTAIRWVDKTEIGTEQFNPHVIVNAKYQFMGNKLILSVTSNLVCVRTGISDSDGNIIAVGYTPARSSVYRKTFDYELPAPDGEINYLAWAEDSSGEKAETSIHVVPAQATPTAVPQETVPPTTSGPTAVPEATQTPALPSPTAVPTPTPVMITPLPTNTAGTGCPCVVNGVHADIPSILENIIVIADEDGLIYAAEGKCKTCGARITCKSRTPIHIGFELGSQLWRKYYTNGDSIDGDLSISELHFKQDVQVDQSAGLYGAKLFVEGQLTVNAPVSNVLEVVCDKLLIGSNGKITSKRDIRTTSGKIEIEAGGSASTDYGDLQAAEGNADIVINGSISLPNHGVHGKNITIGAGASVMASAISGHNCTINGENFQFDGTIFVRWKLNMKHPASCYVETVRFTEPLITMDSRSKTPRINNDLEASTFRAGNVEYMPASDDMLFYFIDDVIQDIGEKIEKNFTGDSGFLTVIEEVKDYASMFQDASGNVSREKCAMLVTAAHPKTDASLPDGLIENRMTMNKVLKRNNRYVEDGRGGFIEEMGKPVSNDSEEGMAYSAAIKHGLMMEMFEPVITKTVTAKRFTIDFSTMKGQYAFSYGGEKWRLKIDPSTLSMKITVTDSHDNSGSSSTDWIIGYIERNKTGEMVKFNFLPDSLNSSYAAIRAAGDSEIAATLSGIISDIFDDALSLISELIPDLELHLGNIVSDVACGFICDTLNATRFFDYETLAYNDSLAAEIMRDLKLDSTIFSEFKDMLELVTNLTNETIKVN